MPRRQSSRLRRTLLAAAAACSTLLPVATAQATWSIIVMDTRTGEIAIGCATCLADFDLRAWTPVIVTGRGAAAAQASINGVQFANRTLIRDRLTLGSHPSVIINALAQVDSSHNSRQYGIVDRLGRRATFTGPNASQWAGGLTGSFDYSYAGQTGTIHYSVQGNILTGANVVNDAIAALQNTPGDVPERLMAAMQAARFAGGDGRCSCSPNNATGCGSPPPNFTKSSHIAYMIISRAGDTDLSHGYYRAGAGARAVAAADVSLNGLIDLVIANTAENTASIVTNTTTPAWGFPAFAAPINRGVGGSPRAVAIADINGDGLPDVLTADNAGNRVSYIRNIGENTFASAVAFAVGAGPIGIVAGNFDNIAGPDVATANAAARTVSILLNDGAGGFLAPATVSLPVAPRQLLAADLDGDGHLDLLMPAEVEPWIMHLRGNGDGTFTPSTPINTPGIPLAAAAGDFNGDGRVDLAVIHQTPALRLSILLNDGASPPGFVSTEHPLPAIPNAIAAGDISGDGHLDVVIPIDGGRFLTYFGSATGSFTPHGNYDLTTTFGGAGATSVALADLDGNGSLDAAFTVPGFNSVVVAHNLGGGVFVSDAGTASGDYFMGLNIAHQLPSAPDPVEQLADLYGPWRTGLVGHTDAVQSVVTAPEDLYAGNIRPGTMLIALRDWQAQPITAPVGSITVAHAPGTPPRTSIGPAVPTGLPGVYAVELTPLNSLGTDRFVITVTGGPRPVVLMPQPQAVVARCPADWNTDNVTNSQDISAFITAWLDSVNTGTLAGDFDGDGQVNSADISAFITRWISAINGLC